MKRYRSNHDCFGNPTFVPDGYPLPDVSAGVPERWDISVLIGPCEEAEAEEAADHVLQSLRGSNLGAVVSMSPWREDGPAGVPDDPRCPLCRIPLRAVTGVTDGRCADIEACAARSELVVAGQM